MDRPDFNLPTPQMLIKKAKEETVPVSLRVKESTVAIFDKMAKEAGVNRGAMMNTLLDFYAQSQNSSNSSNSKDIMISYLNSERFWKIIPSLTSEELIYRMKNKGVDTPEVCDTPSLLRAYNQKDLDSLLALINPLDDDKCDDFIYANNTISCAYNEYSTDLTVTVEQWPLIVVLLSEYSQKYKKLFPEQSIAITQNMYKKIAEECKQFPKPDGLLATAIKNILLDYVEKQND